MGLFGHVLRNLAIKIYETELPRSYHQSSVTRFGRNSATLVIFKSLWENFERSFTCGKNVNLLSICLFVVGSVTRLGDFCTLGNHSKPVATIILPKLPTLSGNFCKDVKIIHFSNEIIIGQLL